VSAAQAPTLRGGKISTISKRSLFLAGGAALLAAMILNNMVNLNGMKLTPADMQPEIGYVPSGVVEVMEKQQ